VLLVILSYLMVEEILLVLESLWPSCNRGHGSVCLTLHYIKMLFQLQMWYSNKEMGTNKTGSLHDEWVQLSLLRWFPVSACGETAMFWRVSVSIIKGWCDRWHDCSLSIHAGDSWKPVCSSGSRPMGKLWAQAGTHHIWTTLHVT
jgi:hypothetical protein